MAENKTKPTDASVASHIAAIPGQDELLSKLGKHRKAKACLSIRKIGDVDFHVLEQLVAGSVAEVRRRYGLR